MVYPPAVEQWRPAVERIFREEGGGSFNPADVDKALYVIQWESSGNPDAQSDSGGYGLMQLNDGGLGEGYSIAQRLDPETNLRVSARAIYGGSGWSPWGEGSEQYNYPYDPNTGKGRFGSLGDRPYQGGGGSGSTPLGGRSQTTAGITYGGGTQRNTYGIYDNLGGGGGMTQQQQSPRGIGAAIGGALAGLFPGQTGGVGNGDGGAGLNGASGGTASAVDQLMAEYGITRGQALQMLGIDENSAADNYIPPDHFFDISPGDERDFGESVFRDRRDFEYNAGQDEADRAIIEAEQAAKAEQQKFDNAMAVGDFQSAQQAAERKNYWDQVAATQENRRLDLTNQGQQLDYNLGLGNIAADRYGTDAQIGIANMQNQTDAALGQQSNRTNQFDAESKRLQIAQDYQLGMANATTDAERVAVEERRRQDTVAIANMEGRNNLLLGQQNNTNTAFANDTDRMRSMQSYYASLAGIANDTARLGIEDAGRLDQNSQFNAGEQNDMTLGQQSNRTNQFGAETDRANRMGELALKQNQFILDAAGQPRNMFSLYMMQRGLAPDWETLGAGGQVAQGTALAPADVMNAYTPVTTPGTFDAVAAQSQAASSGVTPGANPMDTNYFLKNFRDANTATTAVPQFNEQFQAAQGAANSNYDSSQNRFIGADPGYRPTTTAPDFSFTPTNAQPGAWTGPGAVGNFLPSAGAVPEAPKFYQDINPGGLQGGVPLAGLRPGLNLSTVGGGDIKGSDFSLPSFYDAGMTRPIGADDIVRGGSQVYTMYGEQPAPAPSGNPMLPQVRIPGVQRMATGGLTRAPQFITGDDPRQPGGLGENAELNEPIVDGQGIYKGTRITPLNPERRSLGNAWNGDNLAMAAGFGLRPPTLFSKR